MKIIKYTAFKFNKKHEIVIPHNNLLNWYINVKDTHFTHEFIYVTYELI